METVKLRYYGKHSPPGIYMVRKERADELVRNDDFDFVDKPIKTKDNIPKTKEYTAKEYPDKTWTEKRIKKWILKNKIPISYSITNDEKDDILEKLGQGGYFK